MMVNGDIIHSDREYRSIRFVNGVSCLGHTSASEVPLGGPNGPLQHTALNIDLAQGRGLV